MTHPYDQITLVTVAYNSAPVLPTLFASIPSGVEVIVVDNASMDEGAAIARAAGATVIDMARNAGFGSANNAGAMAASRPYVYFANPDSILQPGCLEALHARLCSDADIAALNPAFYLSNGTQQFKRRSPILPRHKWMRRTHGAASGPVNVLLGAGIFLSRDMFWRAGGFDENIFLYHEDDDLSLRLAHHGTLYLETRAQVIHHQGNSSARNPKTGRIKAFYQAQSKRYVFKKYKIRAGNLRLILEGAGKILSPLILFSPWRRAKSFGFIYGLYCSYFKIQSSD